MKIARGAVRLTLGRAVYGPDALAAGALALGERAEVYAGETRTGFSVEIRPAGKASAAALAALAGEFLNEALSHACRQRVVRENAPLTQAVLAPLLAKGFPAVPEDPLEELEPQVREDRTRDLAELLERARGMR